MIRVLIARALLAAVCTAAVALAMHSAGKLGGQLEMGQLSTPHGQSTSSAPAPAPVIPSGCWGDDGLKHPFPTSVYYDGVERESARFVGRALDNLFGNRHDLNLKKIGWFCA